MSDYLLSADVMIRLLVGIPIAIAINTLLGAELGDRKEQFSKAILFSGIRKAIIIYVSIAGLIGLGQLLPELKVLLNNAEYTIQQALLVLLWGEMFYYAGQAVAKLFKLGQSQNKDVVVEPLYDAGIEEEVGLG